MEMNDEAREREREKERRMNRRWDSADPRSRSHGLSDPSAAAAATVDERTDF